MKKTILVSAALACGLCASASYGIEGVDKKTVGLDIRTGSAYLGVTEPPASFFTVTNDPCMIQERSQYPSDTKRGPLWDVKFANSSTATCPALIYSGDVPNDPTDRYRTLQKVGYHNCIIANYNTNGNLVSISIQDGVAICRAAYKSNKNAVYYCGVNRSCVRRQ